MIVDITLPDSTVIRASDRNKYVGNNFYEALCTFPEITRTVGEWLSGELQFSTLTIGINNTDKRFNAYLPGGANYNGFIGRDVVVSLGIGEAAGTYTEIFKGKVTDIGGFSRDMARFTLVARNEFDKVNVTFPRTVLTDAGYPDIEDDKIGLGAPVIYGDWTVNLDPKKPGVPVFPANGANAGVLAGTTHLLVFVSDEAISSITTSGVTVVRGDLMATFNSADIIVGALNRTFQVKQGGSGGVTLLDGNPYIYEAGDQFYAKVKGIDLGTYDDNIVSQAKDLLTRFGNLVSGDFDSNWDTYRDKATPSESAIFNFKSRIWQQESISVMAYVTSMLEQVRLEPFVDRNRKFKLLSLHFDDFATKYAAATFKVKNWDCKRDTFSPSVDEQNNWNRVKADYDRRPDGGEARVSTPIFKNAAAITQAGKDISKVIFFPNLYVENDVILNVKEMLKLASAYSEFIAVTLTSRAALRDIGDFVLLDIDIGSTQFSNVPAMVRDISYNPDGFTIGVNVWSFQLVPFTGWAGQGAGIVGGATASITQE